MILAIDDLVPIELYLREEHVNRTLDNYRSGYPNDAAIPTIARIPDDVNMRIFNDTDPRFAIYNGHNRAYCLRMQGVLFTRAERAEYEEWMTEDIENARAAGIKTILDYKDRIVSERVLVEMIDHERGMKDRELGVIILKE